MVLSRIAYVAVNGNDSHAWMAHCGRVYQFTLSSAHFFLWHEEFQHNSRTISWKNSMPTTATPWAKRCEAHLLFITMILLFWARTPITFHTGKLCISFSERDVFGLRNPLIHVIAAHTHIPCHLRAKIDLKFTRKEIKRKSVDAWDWQTLAADGCLCAFYRRRVDMRLSRRDREGEREKEGRKKRDRNRGNKWLNLKAVNVCWRVVPMYPCHSQNSNSKYGYEYVQTSIFIMIRWCERGDVNELEPPGFGGRQSRTTKEAAKASMASMATTTPPQQQRQQP